jgi:hypothetical protein
VSDSREGVIFCIEGDDSSSFSSCVGYFQRGVDVVCFALDVVAAACEAVEEVADVVVCVVLFESQFGV